jgi:hypothetical protein
MLNSKTSIPTGIITITGIIKIMPSIFPKYNAHLLTGSVSSVPMVCLSISPENIFTVIIERYVIAIMTSGNSVDVIVCFKLQISSKYENSHIIMAVMKQQRKRHMIK